jgi:hypothetical protein
LDAETHAILSDMDLEELELIKLEDFEKGDEALAAAKTNRSRVEYYFTCTPSLPLFVLRHWPEVGFLSYLDADLYLFSSPEPIYREMMNASIAMVAHRFSPGLERMAENGIYNVGWLSFRRDSGGLACLNWWRDRCNEWCFDRIEGNRYADQKYLDEWPRLFRSVRVIEHKGANVAPWNIARYSVRSKLGRIYVDEIELVFFHFEGLKRLLFNVFETGLGHYQVALSRSLREGIYQPYMKELLRIDAELRARYVGAKGIDTIRGPYGGRWWEVPYKKMVLLWAACKGWLRHKSLIVIRGP